MNENEKEWWKSKAREFAEELGCRYEWERDHAFCEYLKIVEEIKHCRIIN